jgi:Domain of unknown function (DUF4160)
VPTVLRRGRFRFVLYLNEAPHEAPHVHALAAEAVAKLWLDPPALAEAGSMAARELRDALAISRRERATLLRAWYAQHPPQP